MKTWPLIAIVILAAAAFFIRHELSVNSFVNECTQRTEQLSAFVTALQSKDNSLCATLDQTLQQRCNAYIANEPSLCPAADLDCVAIASSNASLCVEPICRALATKDSSHCQELTEPEYCTNLATLNAQAFVPNKDACKKDANIPWF